MSDRHGNRDLTRREFIGVTLGTLCAAGVSDSLAATPAGEMQYRTLGRTGEKVSIVGLGGAHIGQQRNENDSIRLIRTAVDRGINFLDNCWDYHGGASEVRMGKALRDGYRNRVFLMSKIDGRDKKTAAAQIDESLRRLQTDHIDLMQHHEIIRMDDPERIFGAGGVQEAMIEAQKAGKIRYIGFTGHKSPEHHLKMLQMGEQQGFIPDTVQLPLNVMDAHYSSFEKKVLPELVKRNIGVIGMKPIGGGYFTKTKTVAPIDCLHYTMNLPTSVVVTGCDRMEILEQAVRAARTFKPMSREEVASLLRRTAQAARAGEWEKYKTSERFDGTVHHPEWLGKPA